MTDKEIIKGIEKCLYNVYFEGCPECPFQKNGDKCMNEMLRNALDLINRQQAEIERLKSPCEIQIKVSENRERAIKAEAVEEFAEELKTKMSDLMRVEMGGHIYYLIGLPFIDKFVKEFAKDINVSTNPEQVKGEADDI